MLVITVARKPVSEGTVAKNVMVYGTGGLNIDACRLGGKGLHSVTQGKGSHGTDGWGMARNVYQVPSGRWPANLILSHLPECQQVGSQASKGRQLAAGSTGFGVGRDDQYKAGTGRQYAEGGTVPVWHCSEGCPVKGLDEQSGVRPGMSGGGATANNANKKTGREVVPSYNRKPSAPFIRGDTGGASRFFKTISNKELTDV